MLLEKLTSEVSRRVQDLLGDSLRNIILFGSYARGDYDEESDIDIMVLADIDENKLMEWQYKVNEIASDVSLDNSIMVCIMLNNKDLFEKRLPILPFYRNVVNDGVNIYAA